MTEENFKPSRKLIHEEIEKLEKQAKSSELIQQMILEERRPIYSVYKWESPERVFEPKDKKWYLMVSSVSMFIIVLALLTENYGLVVAIISLIILLYALNSVRPQNFAHEITNKGISINSTLHTWKKIERFWISRKGAHRFLNILVSKQNKDTEQIITYLGAADVKKIVSYVTQFVDYIPENEINNNFVNKKLFGSIESLSSFID